MKLCGFIHVAGTPVATLYPRRLRSRCFESNSAAPSAIPPAALFATLVAPPRFGSFRRMPAVLPYPPRASRPSRGLRPLPPSHAYVRWGRQKRRALVKALLAACGRHLRQSRLLVAAAGGSIPAAATWGCTHCAAFFLANVRQRRKPKKI